ncbi:MAG: translation initiation factor IF-2 N-terminal domain-containing protein, partial [Planctomycetota bacterium]
MSKVRVYELARQYGVKGPELAKMLKELGFEKVKSHMAVLDDATALHARAVIEAQGLTPQDATPASEKSAGGDDGIPKKKKLSPLKKKVDEPEELPQKKSLPPPIPRKAKKKVSEPEVVEEEPAKVIESAPAAPAQEEPEVAEPTATEAPPKITEAPPTPAAEETRAEPVVEPEAASPVSEVSEPEAAPAETAATTPPVTEDIQEPAPEAAEAEAASEAAPAETEVTAKEKAPATAEADKDKAVKRLLVPKAKAQVVGKIDLPQEAISDARRRSAPGATTGGRNPGGVDRNLRRAALRNTQTRSAGGRQAGRAGSPFRRGPGGGGRRTGGGRQRGGIKSSSGALTPTVDPDKIIEIEPPTSVKKLSEA